MRSMDCSKTTCGLDGSVSVNCPRRLAGRTAFLGKCLLGRRNVSKGLDPGAHGNSVMLTVTGPATASGGRTCRLAIGGGKVQVRTPTTTNVFCKVRALERVVKRSGQAMGRLDVDSTPTFHMHSFVLSRKHGFGNGTIMGRLVSRVTHLGVGAFR